jgi:DNA-binding CsgD family transcriptional regulator
MQSLNLSAHRDAEVILNLFALGFNGAEISDYLGIPVMTLRARLLRLRDKFKARNLSNLIWRALNDEVIEPIPLWAPLNLTPVELEIIEPVAQGLTQHEIGRDFFVTGAAILKRINVAKNRNGAFTTHHLVAMWYSQDCYRPEELENLSVWGSNLTEDLRVADFAIFS